MDSVTELRLDFDSQVLYAKKRGSIFGVGKEYGTDNGMTLYQSDTGEIIGVAIRITPDLLDPACKLKNNYWFQNSIRDVLPEDMRGTLDNWFYAKILKA